MKRPPASLPITPRVAAALKRLRLTNRADFDRLPPALKLALGEIEADERRRAMLSTGGSRTQEGRR